MSAELAKSERIRPIIEELIENELQKAERVSMIDVINSGAYVAHCVQGTVKEHIYALCSKKAPFRMDEAEEFIYRKSQAGRHGE